MQSHPSTIKSLTIRKAGRLNAWLVEDKPSNLLSTSPSTLESESPTYGGKQGFVAMNQPNSLTLQGMASLGHHGRPRIPKETRTAHT